jgi:hypothetical protein
MSGWKTAIARRPLLAGLFAALGIAAAGGAAYEAGLFGPSWPASPYDDLLAALPERARAIEIGRAVLADNPGLDAKAMAQSLRARIAGRTLSDMLAADIAEQAIAEVHGWILPQTLAQLCALAAA